MYLYFPFMFTFCNHLSTMLNTMGKLEKDSKKADSEGMLKGMLIQKEWG